ncbi:MAG: hypothetical protein JXN60_04680 [Lentisphaerae bacterium]|nr:hypothetical protein [Lentisphaerota bacterium]
MSIRATATTRDITPNANVRLAGYVGAPRISAGERDKLLVSAVHLRGGSGGIIIVSLDLLSLDPSFVRTIRKRIVKATGTHEHNIVIGTTQNHSAPVTSRALCWLKDESYDVPDPEYLEYVAEQSVHAASEAAVASLPSKVATIEFDSPNTGAIIVKDLRSGRIPAMIVVYDEIPDLLGSENTQISSDFLHTARERLGKTLGREPVIAYLPAPSGYRRLRVIPKEYGEKAAQRAGERLADQILTKGKALSSNDFVDNISFSGQSESLFDMPQRILPDQDSAKTALAQTLSAYAELDKIGADDQQRIKAKWDIIKATHTINFIHAQENGLLDQELKDSEPAELQLMQFGDQRLLCMPGTIVPECARRIADITDKNLWLAEGINGDLQGSILAINGEDYELQSAIFESQSGAMLVDYARSLFSGK